MLSERDSCPRITHRYTDTEGQALQRFTDLHHHVTITQKCPVTQPELVIDTGTIRHALSEKALYCPRNETQNLSQEATQTPQRHTHCCKGRHTLM